MGSDRHDADRDPALRSRAEQRMAEHPLEDPTAASPLLHELQVHQIELQIQNEELRSAQSQLTVAWEEYRELYEHAPVGYCTLTPEGRVIKANHTLAILLGVEPGWLLGQNLTTFVTAPAQDPFYLFLRGLTKKGSARSILLPLAKSSDETIWARLDARVVEEGGQKVLRTIITDITKERLSEQALEESARLESLGTLAGGIGHDFNNLLGGILGYISLARNSPGLPPSVHRYLDKSVAVFDRARGLTHQLLTFTKHNVPQTKPTNLGPLVEKWATFVLSGSETQLRVTVENDLCPALVDEGQFGQVIDNLVLNASQAMGGRGRVEISAKNCSVEMNDGHGLEAGYYVKLTVTDTGTGIPQALLSKIFAPFFTTKPTGQGLGLASTQSIIKKHGGAIWPESVEGKGTCFHVLLPAAPRGICTDHGDTGAEHQGQGTILVMDDEAFNLEVLSDMLKTVGYEVLQVRDGDEALDCCRSVPELKAAFLDLTNKGGRGGRDTVAPLLELFPGLPVFAVSGYREDPIISHPRDYGFSDSLGKPFRKSDLVAMLAKHLG